MYVMGDSLYDRWWYSEIIDDIPVIWNSAESAEFSFALYLKIQILPIRQNFKHTDSYLDLIDVGFNIFGLTAIFGGVFPSFWENIPCLPQFMKVFLLPLKTAEKQTTMAASKQNVSDSLQTTLSPAAGDTILTDTIIRDSSSDLPFGALTAGDIRLIVMHSPCLSIMMAAISQ